MCGGVLWFEFGAAATWRVIDDIIILRDECDEFIVFWCFCLLLVWVCLG